MKIRILGSGGGEGFPATFCTCEHCEAARKKGGKSLRSLSQTLIDDDLLIDFPADTGMHCLQYGINLGQIENVLITHTHSDHFVPIAAVTRGGLYAHELKYPTLKFYGPENLRSVFDGLTAPYGMDPSIRKNLEFIRLSDRCPTRVGRYTVTALTAPHAPHLGSLNYVIDDGKKSLLYLIDSGYPTEDTLEYLRSLGRVFDGVVLDGTMGVAPSGQYVYHMGFEENKKLKSALCARGLANEKTKFVVTHITHNKAETHDNIERIFEGSGIVVAFDGITLTL